MMNETIRLKPLYKERVWGGRKLESIFNRQLPKDSGLIGESWDVVDRDEDQSLVIDGEMQGMTLNELWVNHKELIFGTNLPQTQRFPLLVKVLDATEKLSLQVHPPESIVSGLEAEPKTEMWYIAEAEPEAEIYCGLSHEITPDVFMKNVNGGFSDDMLHKIRVSKGDFIFIPSGRLHAIGGGIVIFEIQQNSDTTYRVHDWGRTDSDGCARDLHINEALRSINFQDVGPSKGTMVNNFLVQCPYFEVELLNLSSMESINGSMDENFAIISIIDGALSCGRYDFMSGDSFIVPAQSGAEPLTLISESSAKFLRTTIPKNN